MAGPKGTPLADSPAQAAPGAAEKELNMLWTIVVILAVLWLLGMIGNIGGSLIHILLVIAVVVVLYNLITGRRAV